MLIKSSEIEKEYRCHCGYIGSTSRGLGKHLKLKHPEVDKRLFWEGFYSLPRCKCKCGCGSETQWSSKTGYVGYHDFIPGHNLNAHDPWNKGLSKKTDRRLMLLSDSISETIKKKWDDGVYANRNSNVEPNAGCFTKGLTPWNKGTGHPSIYSDEFSKELKSKIKDIYSHQCVRCRSEKSLVVHHMDTDKTNNDIDNLMLMCRSCHMKVHAEIAKSRNLNYRIGEDVSDRIAGYKVKDFSVEIIDYANAKNKIINNHYTGTCPSPKFSFGLVKDGFTYGVVIYSLPSRQTIAKSIGYENGDVLELSRMFIHEGMPKNSASYLIGKTLKYLKQSRYKAIVTYADSTEGHTGNVYLAANFKRHGEARKNYHYEDKFGNRFHKRAVWDRAKKCGRKEKDQADMEGLTRVVEMEKPRFIYQMVAV